MTDKIEVRPWVVVVTHENGDIFPHGPFKTSQDAMSWANDTIIYVSTDHVAIVQLREPKHT